ncbi:MAG: 6-phosphogluconolactonase [Bacteroidetes bacterium GWF2_41_61]|nr:MAG: 6-phosphogluconolactonase [Bacteroidetes bacterium GWE2_40_15]OFY34666.1 MAG: 6-phosphogluconolactonase [Bacteroidetes bacterium GWF2_41_61]OFY88278.1 MAG: 6-phosphogluconolactonase [Bacteroidetes bacterium RIFOXYA12_FULL_40_10]HBG23527.1 6-phosphogluconolactonase [Rikenellaceae bacterium]HBZ25872.1 6-phosphogluconolactonase [Rikenellaceae bacterium]
MDKSRELTILMASMIEEKLLHSGKASKQDTLFSLAISGGGSPARLFELWATEWSEKIPWERVAFFWVDERAVPPDDAQSNYGMAKRLLFDRLPISSNNLFRIAGERDPVDEALRYSALVESILPVKNGIPQFDLIILGVGEDGHTASIFPGQEHLYHTQCSYSTSVNPHNGQSRITMTGSTILNSKKSIFYLTGESKREIVKLIRSNIGNREYPAGYFLKFLKEESIFWDES